MTFLAKWRKAKVRIVTCWDASKPEWALLGYEAHAVLYTKHAVEFVSGGRRPTEDEARAALELRTSEQTPLVMET